MTGPIAPDPASEPQLRQKIKEGSAGSDDYTKLGGLLFFTGNLEEAVLLSRQAIDLAQTRLCKARACIEFAWIYYGIDQREEARTLAQQALELLETKEDSPEWLACLGAGQTLMAQLKGNDVKVGQEAVRVALRTLEKVLSENTEFAGKAMAYYEAASLYGGLGNPNRAIMLAEKCLGYPLNEWERISCLTILADALRQAEQVDKAQRILIEAIELAQRYKTTLANLYLHLGLVQRFSGPVTQSQHLMKAQDTLQQAVRALEDDPYRQKKCDLRSYIYLNLATVRYELGEFKKAGVAYEEVLRSVSQDHHNFWEAQLRLGQCYQAEGSYAKARSYFENVLRSSDSSAEQKFNARECLATSLYELREYRKASEILEELSLSYSRDDPRQAGATLLLGYCYEGLGDQAKARSCYEQVLAAPHALPDDKTAAQEGLRRLPPSGQQTTH